MNRHMFWRCSKKIFLLKAKLKITSVLWKSLSFSGILSYTRISTVYIIAIPTIFVHYVAPCVGKTTYEGKEGGVRDTLFNRSELILRVMTTYSAHFSAEVSPSWVTGDRRYEKLDSKLHSESQPIR